MDINISENMNLVNKIKLKDQIIILLSSNINSLKSELKSFQQYAIDKFNLYLKDNQSNIKLINQAMNNILNNDNNFSNGNNSLSNNNQELYNQLNIYKNENKQLYNNQKEYTNNIRLFNKKCDNYEKEKNNLTSQINKLKLEIQLLNQSLTTIKNCNKIEFSNYIKKYSNIIKGKLVLIKNKYLQEIGELKTMIGVITCGMKKYNSIVSTNIKSRSEEVKNKKLIEEMKKKIYSYKLNQEEYIKAINKKNKKIKELQDALNKSFMSLSSGMKNIKIANLLDNEVKEFLKKSKETNENDNNE